MSALPVSARQLASFSTAQLHLVVLGAPERRVLWTVFETAAADELDRRLA